MAGERPYPVGGGVIMLIRLALACVLLASVALASAAVPQSTEDPVVVFTRREIATARTYRPPSGYVPDSKAAIAIAVAVLTPIYGKGDIESEKPWHTGLNNGVWTVVGTFNGKGVGGSAVIQLDQKTGEVLLVTHTM
jgi:NTF2 fold immunity protein